MAIDPSNLIKVAIVRLTEKTATSQKFRGIIYAGQKGYELEIGQPSIGGTELVKTFEATEKRPDPLERAKKWASRNSMDIAWQTRGLS